MATRARGRANPWRREVDDLLRGLSGGLLFGIPLLYTMETWWIGETISPLRALILLAVAYALNLAFVSWAGFRRQEAGSNRPSLLKKRRTVALPPALGPNEVLTVPTATGRGSGGLDSGG